MPARQSGFSDKINPSRPCIGSAKRAIIRELLAQALISSLEFGKAA
jgi:hypothetical protein